MKGIQQQQQSSYSSSSQNQNQIFIERLRAQIINLSQNYENLLHMIIDSRQDLQQLQSPQSSFDDIPSSYSSSSQSSCQSHKNQSFSYESTSLDQFSYQEDALILKHLCNNFSRCKKHDVCKNFHQIVKEYRIIEDQFNRVFDSYENISDKSQICVVSVLFEKLYEYQLQLEEYFTC